MNAHPDHIARKNARIGLIVLAAFVFMLGMSFAAVPFYNMFCRITGYSGTTGIAETLPEQVLDRIVTVQFSANTARGMTWYFRPEEKKIDIQLGERGLTAFYAKNKMNYPTGGTALYNVTPLKAGKYFKKIQCFCFDEQVLDPYQEVTMPVIFYVDPALNDDPNMQDVTTITLSYTFFTAESAQLDQALEAFYNAPTHDIND